MSFDNSAPSCAGGAPLPFGAGNGLQRLTLHLVRRFFIDFKDPV
jgi:hypothetical protein